MKQRGFTLIELMVTVTIVVLVTGISISAYLTFSESRQTEIDAKSFLSAVRKVRFKAIFLEYPDDCTNLSSYFFETVSGTSGVLDSVHYYAVCSQGQRGETTEKVLSTTTFDSATSFSFLPISGNLSSTEDVEVSITTIKGNSMTKKIIVSQSMDTNSKVEDN